MNRETIEKAALELCTTEGQEEWLKDYGKNCFMDGARWRINSVWHEVRKKPDKGKLLIVEDIDSAYELVYLTNSKPWEELSKKNHYMHWAYVADLLPERKEAQP